MASPEPPEVLDTHILGSDGLLKHLLQLAGNTLVAYLPQGILDLRDLANDPATPPLTRQRFYSKNGFPFWKDPDADVRSIGAGLPVKGSLLAGDGTQICERVVGTPGQVLTVDPNDTKGISWHAPGQPPDVAGQTQLGSILHYDGTANPVSSEIQYTRVFLPAGLVSSRMQVFHILGGSAARLINMGLYDQVDPTDLAGVPNDKIDETGTVATNVGTNTFITVAFSGGPVMTAVTGFYWLAFIADTGVPLQFASTGGTYPANFVPMRREASVGTTLPATASGLSNPPSAVIFTSVLEP